MCDLIPCDRPRAPSIGSSLVPAIPWRHLGLFTLISLLSAAPLPTAADAVFTVTPEIDAANNLRLKIWRDRSRTGGFIPVRLDWTYQGKQTAFAGASQLPKLWPTQDPVIKAFDWEFGDIEIAGAWFKQSGRWTIDVCALLTVPGNYTCNPPIKLMIGHDYSVALLESKPVVDSLYGSIVENFQIQVTEEKQLVKVRAYVSKDWHSKIPNKKVIFKWTPEQPPAVGPGKLKNTPQWSGAGADKLVTWAKVYSLKDISETLYVRACFANAAPYEPGCTVVAAVNFSHAGGSAYKKSAGQGASGFGTKVPADPSASSKPKNDPTRRSLLQATNKQLPSNLDKRPGILPGKSPGDAAAKMRLPNTLPAGHAVTLQTTKTLALPDAQSKRKRIAKVKVDPVDEGKPQAVAETAAVQPAAVSSSAKTTAMPKSKKRRKSALAAADKKFSNPMLRRHRLDWCLNWGSGCGQPAADTWCAQKGFGAAKSFQFDPDIGAQSPTLVIGDNKVCAAAGCDGFREIVCTNNH